MRKFVLVWAVLMAVGLGSAMVSVAYAGCCY